VDIDSTSALKVHPLSFTEILRTHPDVFPTWEDRADQGDEDPRTPAEMDDVHLRAPYVCVISSPNLTGQGGPEARYRYDGVVLDFPPAVLATARSMSSGGGVPTRMIEVQTGAHVNPRHTEAQVLRWARCRVPDVPGVQDMVTERLGYADYQPGRVGNGARDSGASERDVGKRTAQDLREWEGVPVEDRTFAALVRPPRKTSCYTEYVCTRSCSTCSLENCVSKGVTCHGFGGGTSGSGGSGTGYDDGGYPGTGPIPTIYPDDPEIVLVPVNPCERDDPPDYCDQAGSCYDSNVGNEGHNSVLRGLEENGALSDRWSDTNAGARDQDERAERNSFIIRENGNYRTEPFSEYGNITTTSCTVRGNVNVPSNAVGVLHFQPFSNGERITSRECLEAQGVSNPEQFLGPDADQIVTYNSDPSSADKDMADQYGLDTYVMDKDNITVVSKDGTTEGAYSRCGY